MAAPTYREQIDAQRIMRIREISRDLPQACGDFLHFCAVTTGTFTRLAYALDFRTFFYFLHAERVRFADKAPKYYTDEDLAALTASDLIAYTDYLSYYFKDHRDEEGQLVQVPIVNHDLAIKRKLCSIRSLYGYLYQAHRIQNNETLRVKLPKIHEKPIIRLSSEEVMRLLHEAETGDHLSRGQQRFQKITARRDYAMLMLFLGTGIRVSECVGIDLTDIDLEQNAVLVTRKGGNQMVLYYPPEVAQALEEYLEERSLIEPLPGHENALFLSLQRRRITQRAVEKLVKKYAETAAPLKPKISPHKLRSTYATNLYQQTGDIYLVANVLGHSSVDTTRKHYADLDDARRRMAADHVFLPLHGELPSGAPDNEESSPG